MSTSSYLPSYFTSPLITTIPTVKYSSNGRQMPFEETEVQRLERLAFIKASKSSSSSRSASPASSSQGSPSPSSSPSPRMKLISEPYCDPIELMANRLAEEFDLFMASSSDELSSSDDELPLYQQTPSKPARRTYPSHRPSSSFKPGHRRKQASLFAIPEED